MIELLVVYLALGALAALAQGRWRVRDLARATLIWPALLPRMLRADPSPPDAPPGLAAWEQRVKAALGSLETAIQQAPSLPDGRASQPLLEDTRRDLLAIARRHAELSAVLAAPENDLGAARSALDAAADHRLPALAQRARHVEQLHAAHEALETQLESGLAAVMNLAARLHLARATDAPIPALHDKLRDIAAAVEGVVEAEEVIPGPLAAALPPGWRPAAAVKDPPSPEQREAFQQIFEQTSALPVPASAAALPAIPDAPRSKPDTPQRSQRLLAAVIAILGAGSLFYRVVTMGHLEQTSLMFVGLPAVLAMLVALMPRPRSYLGMLVKLTTLMLLLSGVILAEGLICILMAAPLFYFMAITAGVLLDVLRSRSASARVIALTPLILLSLEGTTPLLTAPRAEVVSAQSIVALEPDAVAAALARRPDFQDPMPFFLRMGFPHPKLALGEGLDVGDRRVIRFEGGEDPPGNLELEVVESGPGRVIFAARRDSSRIAHWLTWRFAEVRWRAVSPGKTEVRWTFYYQRELDPAAWFGPLERFAVGLAAQHLIDALVGRPDDAP